MYDCRGIIKCRKDKPDNSLKYNNPSYMVTGITDRNNYPHSATLNFTCVPVESPPPSYSDSMIYANIPPYSANHNDSTNCLTHDTPATNQLTSNRDQGVTERAAKHSTSSQVTAGKQANNGDVYAVVCKSREDNFSGDTVYSLADETEDDLVVVENDLYST